MNKSELLAHVEKSPKAVAIHDRPAWLAIFADHYHVEDPVGSAPHLGKDDRLDKESLGRFYDTFIAPNHIRFEVAHDMVNDMHVVRDLTVHTTMSDKLSVAVPMHLLYELEEQNGLLRIKRLAAHWELLPMMGQVFSQGLACVPVLFALSMRMIRLQGFAGIIGFCKAAFSVGRKGKDKVEDFFADLNQKHFDRLQDYLEEETGIHFGEQVLQGFGLEHWDFDHFETGKVIAAGHYVTVSFLVHSGGGERNDTRSGVAFFKFNRAHERFVSVRFYC